MLLESYEPHALKIRAAHVQFFKFTIFGLLDRLPEKESHATEVVESGVGATVFINHRLLVRERDHRGNRVSILGGDPDLEVLSEAVGQVVKP